MLSVANLLRWTSMRVNLGHFMISGIRWRFPKGYSTCRSYKELQQNVRDHQVVNQRDCEYRGDWEIEGAAATYKLYI